MIWKQKLRSYKRTFEVFKASLVIDCYGTSAKDRKVSAIKC